jgi:cell division protein FtsQ
VTPTNRRVAAPSQPVDDGSVKPPPGSVEARSAARLWAFGSTVRTAFGVAAVVGASVGVGWVTRRHITTSPRFALTTVEVVGNDRRSPDAIAAESGIARGVNVFSVDLDSARAAILADPWIAEATLTRRLPGTILVQVVERRPAAIIALGDLLLATSDGEAFKKFETGDPADLPLVTGLTADGAADDREAARRTVRRAIDLAAEYAQCVLSKRAPLEEVHVDSSGAFTLVVGRVGMQLVVGRPPFRRKLDEAVRVVAELDKRRATAEAIMLDNDARPERVVARLRSAVP